MKQGTKYYGQINIGEPICDFCSQTPVTRRFHCTPFVMSETTIDGEHFTDHSPDDWAACAVCATLVDAGDREGLAERSVRQLAEEHPILLTNLRAYAQTKQEIRVLHAKCFDHMTGSTPIPEGRAREDALAHLPETLANMTRTVLEHQ